VNVYVVLPAIRVKECSIRLKRFSMATTAPPGEPTKERRGPTVEADVFGIQHDLAQAAPAESGLESSVRSTEDEAQSKPFAKGRGRNLVQAHREPDFNAPGMGQLFSICRK
jgi:hypothetical protein